MVQLKATGSPSAEKFTPASETVAPMTLSDWRANVSAHLQFIEAGAEMAARHARMIPCKAPFETKAQLELAATRKALEAALTNIAAAEAAYNAKPLEAA